MSQLKWLWTCLGKTRPAFIVGMILSGITSGILVVNPMLSQRLIDDVVVPGNTEPLIGILVAMFCVQIARLSLRYLMVVCLELSSNHVMASIRRSMYEMVQAQDYRFLGRFNSGKLMTRMTGDLDMMRHAIAWLSYVFVDSIVVFVAVFTFLIFVNWQLTLCLVAITPFILFVSNRFTKRIRPRFMLLRGKLTLLSTTVTENLDGNRVVKAFAREEYEKEKFEKHNAIYRDISYENALISAKYQPVLEGLSQIPIILTLLLGGLFLMNGSLTPGQYLAFSSLTWALVNPLRTLGMLLADWARFNTSATMIKEVVNAEPGISDRPGAIPLPARPKGGVEFKNVSLKIEENTILEDIDFKIEPGQTVGILGSTGSGKTSLVNLLTHFYEPTSGEVLVDGVNIQKYTLSSLRRHIGVAMQDVFLFSDSVKGNIAYGRPELDEDSIKRRAVQADADSFIRDMQDGYDTLVGERGVGLSGGQRQRIALARALAVAPAILVLDDTTSAVDSETERYIQEQLRDLDFSCTKIIIAQRLTSFRGADIILVMDKGRIIERGTHKELLANKGFYHNIWTLQNRSSPETDNTQEVRQ